MNNQKIINEINLMRAHASEFLKIADRLTERLGEAGVSTPAKSRKKGLSDEQKARFSARRNKKRLSYLNRLTNKEANINSTP